MRKIKVYKTNEHKLTKKIMENKTNEFFVFQIGGSILKTNIDEFIGK